MYTKYAKVGSKFYQIVNKSLKNCPVDCKMKIADGFIRTPDLCCRKQSLCLSTELQQLILLELHFLHLINYVRSNTIDGKCNSVKISC